MTSNTVTHLMNGGTAAVTAWSTHKSEQDNEHIKSALQNKPERKQRMLHDHKTHDGITQRHY